MKKKKTEPLLCEFFLFPNHDFLALKIKLPFILSAKDLIYFSTHPEFNKNEKANDLQKSIGEYIANLIDTNKNPLIERVCFDSMGITVKKLGAQDWKNIGPLLCDYIKKFLFEKRKINVEFANHNLW